MQVNEKEELYSLNLMALEQQVAGSAKSVGMGTEGKEHFIPGDIKLQDHSPQESMPHGLHP